MSRLPRYRFEGGSARVTGAASGIGAALASGLAARASHLELLDLDEEGLAVVAQALRSAHPDVRVTARTTDLRDRAATAETLERVVAESPRLTLVVNNAGVALAGRFEQQSLEDVDWLLDVNLRATVAVTHQLLPALLGAPGSHLVNLSSVFGLVAPPGQVAYATSKFAVRGFSDALGAELAGRVGVTSVHPGGVATAIARSAGPAPGRTPRWLPARRRRSSGSCPSPRTGQPRRSCAGWSGDRPGCWSGPRWRCRTSLHGWRRPGTGRS